MNDTIYRRDAIQAVWKPQVKPNELIFDALKTAIESEINNVPSADRPQGDVDAVDIFEREMHNLEQGYITLGEFDERIEPLRHLCYGRPQGEWIHNPNGIDRDFIWWKCSECGHVIYSESEHDRQEFHAFCGRCGARMKGADNGEDIPSADE